jgi:hypothetical protein
MRCLYARGYIGGTGFFFLFFFFFFFLVWRQRLYKSDLCGKPSCCSKRQLVVFFQQVNGLVQKAWACVASPQCPDSNKAQFVHWGSISRPWTSFCIIVLSIWGFAASVCPHTRRARNSVSSSEQQWKHLSCDLGSTFKSHIPCM